MSPAGFFTLLSSRLGSVRLLLRPRKAVPPLALLLLLQCAIEAIGAQTFTDANWTSIGGLSGPNGPVYAVAVDASGSLYIGGQFTSVGGVFATNVAKWNGSGWSALGSGLNGAVRALAVSGNDIYAGGSFRMAATNVVNAIAKWSGGSWSAIGAGVNGEVYALAVSGSNLYAGGVFTMAGGNGAGHIAKWSGSTWSALGLGIGGGQPIPAVAALAASGSNLYVGGDFMFAGTNMVNHIARWDGSRWSALGLGIDGPNSERSGPVVGALAASGSNVYVGGRFTSAGGTPANYVARWNGNSWSALASGIGGDPLRLKFVSALAITGSNVYVGGFFTNAGGIAANYIAKWNGNNWSALASGVNSNVFALAVSGHDLYAGGRFGTAGGKLSSNLARAYLPVLPTLSVLRSGADVTLS